MAKYKTFNYRQRVLLPVSLEDQLMPGTLEFAIHTLVEKRLDMSIFAGKYRNDETGRAAYDPKCAGLGGDPGDGPASFGPPHPVPVSCQLRPQQGKSEPPASGFPEDGEGGFPLRLGAPAGPGPGSWWPGSAGI